MVIVLMTYEISKNTFLFYFSVSESRHESIMYVKILHFTVYLIILGAGRCHKTDIVLNFDYFILIHRRI